MQDMQDMQDMFTAFARENGRKEIICRGISCQKRGRGGEISPACPACPALPRQRTIGRAGRSNGPQARVKLVHAMRLHTTLAMQTPLLGPWQVYGRIPQWGMCPRMREG
jgi:hypothetical protein